MRGERPTDEQLTKILRTIGRLLAPILNKPSQETAGIETPRERKWRMRCLQAEERAEKAEAKLTEAGVLWRGGRRTRSKKRASDD